MPAVALELEPVEALVVRARRPATTSASERIGPTVDLAPPPPAGESAICELTAWRRTRVSTITSRSASSGPLGLAEELVPDEVAVGASAASPGPRVFSSSASSRMKTRPA